MAVCAAAEIALVSLRDSQVKQFAHRGRRGRDRSPGYTRNPNRFLSAVQVGVTLAGFLSAAFGGAILANALRPVLQELVPMNDEVAEAIALVVITALIAYVSIVLGELTAKRLALQRAERCALALAPLVDLTASLARPVIWLLGVSTNAVVRVLGGDPSAAREEITDEEIRALVRGSSTLRGGGTADRRRCFRCWSPEPPRGDGAPHRGGLPGWGHPSPSSRPRCAQCRALPLSGDRWSRPTTSSVSCMSAIC